MKVRRSEKRIAIATTLGLCAAFFVSKRLGLALGVVAAAAVLIGGWAVFLACDYSYSLRYYPEYRLHNRRIYAALFFGGAATVSLVASIFSWLWLAIVAAGLFVVTLLCIYFAAVAWARPKWLNAQRRRQARRASKPYKK